MRNPTLSPLRSPCTSKPMQHFFANMSLCSCRLGKFSFQSRYTTCISLELFSESSSHCYTVAGSFDSFPFEFHLHCSVEFRFLHGMQNSGIDLFAVLICRQVKSNGQQYAPQESLSEVTGLYISQAGFASWEGNRYMLFYIWQIDHRHLHCMHYLCSFSTLTGSWYIKAVC